MESGWAERTGARLMRAAGLSGVSRRKWVTTGVHRRRARAPHARNPASWRRSRHNAESRTTWSIEQLKVILVAGQSAKDGACQSCLATSDGGLGDMVRDLMTANL
jgi:hypothetical protein